MLFEGQTALVIPSPYLTVSCKYLGFPPASQMPLDASLEGDVLTPHSWALLTVMTQQPPSVEEPHHPTHTHIHNTGDSFWTNNSWPVRNSTDMGNGPQRSAGTPVSYSMQGSSCKLPMVRPCSAPPYHSEHSPGPQLPYSSAGMSIFVLM